MTMGFIKVLNDFYAYRNDYIVNHILVPTFEWLISQPLLAIIVIALLIVWGGRPYTMRLK